MAKKKRKEHTGYFTSTLDQWQKLHPMAKEMRREPTPEEDALWQELRREALGMHFRRQHPVGGYVPDFVCLSRTLAIEVDGAVHDAQKDRDQNRDGYLERLGYQVLRFSNDQVMKDMDTVLETIREAIRARSSVEEAEE